MTNTPAPSRPSSPIVSIHDEDSMPDSPVPPLAEASDIEDYLKLRWQSNTSFTHIEELRDSTKITAKMARILGLAHLDDSSRNNPDIQYHLRRLRRHFPEANQAAALHCDAAWTYPLRLAQTLQRLLDEDPCRGKVAIMVPKGKYIYNGVNGKPSTNPEAKYHWQPDHDVIRYTPIPDNNMGYRGGSLFPRTHWSFMTNPHRDSPSPQRPASPESSHSSDIVEYEEGLTVPLIRVHRSPSYHVRSPSPQPQLPTLLKRMNTPTAAFLFPGNDTLIDATNPYAHPGPPFIKNKSRTAYCVKIPITNIHGAKMKAKYVHYNLMPDAPHARLTMGKGQLVFMMPLRARPTVGHHTPVTAGKQAILEDNPAFAHLVDRALWALPDPFLQGEVIWYRHLGKEMTKTHEELAKADREVEKAQRSARLTRNRFTVQQMEFLQSVDRLEEADAYCTMFNNLEDQTRFRTTDTPEEEEARAQLKMRLQYAGRPYTPEPLPVLNPTLYSQIASPTPDITTGNEEVINIYDGE
ncbi:hypothetical protein BJV78DRAFT_1288645 [Lactifluus subvellereus]|nr:hypothetical protein BJV78DRAFT_1288645 [Lactifluus subvellereus]